MYTLPVLIVLLFVGNIFGVPIEYRDDESTKQTMSSIVTMLEGIASATAAESPFMQQAHSPQPKAAIYRKAVKENIPVVHDHDLDPVRHLYENVKIIVEEIGSLHQIVRDVGNRQSNNTLSAKDIVTANRAFSAKLVHLETLLKSSVSLAERVSALEDRFTVTEAKLVELATKELGNRVDINANRADIKSLEVSLQDIIRHQTNINKKTERAT